MKSKNKFSKKIYLKKKTRKLRGGYGENIGFPLCTELSQFKITDENIENFARHFSSPMDCFINALQIIGFIDEKCGNLMRISSVGRNGFTREEIEIIYIYLTGNNYDFKPTNNFDEFVKEIESKILPGYAVFAGFEDNFRGKIYKHVFLIAKKNDNTIFYIDPQIPTICNVNECQNNYLKNHQTWYLLFNSTVKLNEYQKNYIVSKVPFLKDF